MASRYELEYQAELKQQAREDKVRQRQALVNRINKMSGKKLAEGIFDGSISREEVVRLYPTNNQASWLKVCEHFYSLKSEPADRRQKFCRLLSHVLSVSDNFLDVAHETGGTNRRTHYNSGGSTGSYPNVKALIHIADILHEAIRPPEEWAPKRNNPHLQLVSLVEHLFARYSTPRFLINSFTGGYYEGMLLYQYLGTGGSYKDFPFKPNMVLRNKAFQYLKDVPDDFSYWEGFRYIQVLSLGGNDKLYHALMKTQEIRQGAGGREPFWATVIELYCKADMFDYEQVPQINDYINHKLFTATPKNPYTMKGKTIEMLLRQSEKWHTEEALRQKYDAMVRRQGAAAEARARRVLGFRYVPPAMLPNWKGINVPEWSKQVKTASGGKHEYKITQIKTHRGLIDEGATMHHCVGSYASSCASGLKAIFSLRDFDQPMVTIEVTGGEVVQAKGPRNRSPEGWQMNLIKEWATKNRLGMGRYL